MFITLGFLGRCHCPDKVKYTILAKQSANLNSRELGSIAIFLARINYMDTVAHEMSALLGWNGAETQMQKENYRAEAILGQLYLG
jgi:hypothetical protein